MSHECVLEKSNPLQMQTPSHTITNDEQSQNIHPFESNMNGGIQQLQNAIDNSMQNHWQSFREEYHANYEQFRKDYIEPSITFIETQKISADEKYKTLEKEHADLQQKYQDVSRYNSLLLEKVDTLETELKSFSQVSMIAKFERQCRNKTSECEQIQSKHDALKSKFYDLQKENLVLNSQLEKKNKNLESNQVHSTCSIQTSTISKHQDKQDEPLQQTKPESCKTKPESASKLSSFIDSFSNTSKHDVMTPVQTVQTTDQDQDQDTHKALQSNCKTSNVKDVSDVKDVKDVKDINECNTLPISEQHQSVINTVDTVDENNDKQHPKETESKSVKTQNEPTIQHETLSHHIETSTDTTDKQNQQNKIEAQEDILIQQTKPDTLKEDATVVEVQQPITYKIKRLKRPKVDTEKQQYLFGSDNKLYIFIDEHTAGEEVGQQIEKNGKKMFKFHKK